MVRSAAGVETLVPMPASGPHHCVFPGKSKGPMQRRCNHHEAPHEGCCRCSPSCDVATLWRPKGTLHGIADAGSPAIAVVGSQAESLHGADVPHGCIGRWHEYVRSPRPRAYQAQTSTLALGYVSPVVDAFVGEQGGRGAENLLSEGPAFVDLKKNTAKL